MEVAISQYGGALDARAPQTFLFWTLTKYGRQCCRTVLPRTFLFIQFASARVWLATIQFLPYVLRTSVHTTSVCVYAAEVS